MIRYAYKKPWAQPCCGMRLLRAHDTAQEGCSGMELNVTRLEQVPPITPTKATVKLEFLLPGRLPDIVEVYVAPPPGPPPRQVVKVAPPERKYLVQLNLQAGAHYNISVCPRTLTGGRPDEMIDGEYWEWWCSVHSIVTKASIEEPSPPQIRLDYAAPKTLQRPNRMRVSWSASHYTDGVIEWGPETMPAQRRRSYRPRVNFAGVYSDESQETDIPLRSATRYSFKVSIRSGNTGQWISSTALYRSAANTHSVREFLRRSEIPPGGLRAVFGSNSSVRAAMGLETS